MRAPKWFAHIHQRTTLEQRQALWCTFFATWFAVRAAASAAATRLELAEREPSEEEHLIGSGWLSSELPNYPHLDTWGRLPEPQADQPQSEDDVGEFPPAFVGEPDNRAHPAWTWGGLPSPEQSLAAWREEYIDFCEVVRGCAARRSSLDLPVVLCERRSPCVLCRHHPGASVPRREYWTDLPESEIEERIAEREAERSLRDEAIERVRGRLSRHEREKLHGWRVARSSPSRSPVTQGGDISVQGPSS